MTIKEELEGIKKRITVLIWLILGTNGIKMSGDVISLVSAYMAKGVA